MISIGRALCVGSLTLAFCGPVIAGVNSWTVTGPEGGSTLSVGIHPTQPNTLLAQVGGLFYRSTDAGLHWSYTPGSQVGAVTRIAFDPTNPNLVFMGSDRLYRSNDGGQTFAEITSAAVTGGIRQLAVAADGAVFIIDYGAHALRSLDHGQTWTQLPGTWASNAVLSSIDTDPGDANILYVGVEAQGLYRSEDRGNSWIAPVSSPVMFGGGSVFSVAVQPGNSDRLLAGTTGGYAVSSNRGTTWSFFAAFQSTASVAFDPLSPDDAVAITHYGQVYRSADGGVTWPVPLNGPFLDVLGVSGVAVSGSQSGRFIVATNDGPYLSDDGGATLQPRFNGLHAGYPSGFAAADDGSLFASQSAGPVGLFARGAGSWSPLGNAALRAASPTYTRIDNFAVCASDPSVMYVVSSGTDVMLSTDGGATWSAPIAEFAPGMNRHAQVVAIDPSNPDIAFVGTYSAGLWKTVNRGATWNQLTGLPDRVDKIGIHPADPDTAYVATVGAASVNAIYKTTNGGTSWSQTGAVRDGNFAGFTFDPADPETVYAFGGDVLRSTNGGGSWVPLDFGPPHGRYSRAQAMMVDPLIPSTLWVVGTQDGRSVQRSVNSGATWELITRDVPQGDIFAPFDEGILDPLHPHRVHVGATLLGILEYDVAPDLAVAFTNLASPIPADGELIAYLNVRNNGPHASSASELRLTLPSWMTVNPPAGCALAGSVLTCSQAALQVGQSRDTMLNLSTAQAPANGQISSTVTGHEPDAAGANDSASLTLSSTIQAPIDLILSPHATHVVHNDMLPIQVHVSNEFGRSRARDVHVELQTGTLAVQSVTAGVGTCTHTQTTVSCNLGTLESGTIASVYLDVQVTAIGANVLNGTATRAGGDAAASETTALQISASPLADFALEMTAASSSVVTGGALTYTTTVRNVGPDPTTSRVVANFTNVTVGTATTTGGTCAVANGSVTCDMNTLAAGSAATISIAATAGSVGTASVTGTVTAGGADRQAANNAATVSTAVSAPPASSSSGGGGGGGRFDWLALLLLGGLAAATRGRGVTRWLPRR